MLNRVEARAGCKHPAGIDPPYFVVERDFIDLNKTGRERRFCLRARVTDPWRDLQRTKLDRFTNVNIEGDDTSGDLV